MPTVSEATATPPPRCLFCYSTAFSSATPKMLAKVMALHAKCSAEFETCMTLTPRCPASLPASAPTPISVSRTSDNSVGGGVGTFGQTTARVVAASPAAGDGIRARVAATSVTHSGCRAALAKRLHLTLVQLPPDVHCCWDPALVSRVLSVVASGASGHDSGDRTERGSASDTQNDGLLGGLGVAAVCDACCASLHSLLKLVER